MSQPPSPYDRQYNFTDFQSANPTTPLPGQKVDQELNAARTAINATISRLGEVQADDGKVRNSALNLTTIAEAITPLLSQAPVQAVNAAGASQVAAVNAAGSTQISAVNAAAAAGQALIAAETTTSNATIILSAQATATTAAQNAAASATSAQINADLAYQRYVQANNAVIAAQNAEMAAEGAAASAATASSSASSSAAIATTEASTANQNQLLAETHMMAALAAKAEAEAAANTAQTIVNNGAAAITAQVQPFLDDAAASATSAHNSANEALTYRTQAAGSASSAANSATNASASATSAANQATAAANSATAAANSAASINPANFAPAVHTHTIANVTGLQTALDGKAASSHTHTIANVTGLQSALDAKIGDAPSNGNQYVRQNGSWAINSGGVSEAPISGQMYARYNGGWVAFDGFTKPADGLTTDHVNAITTASYLNVAGPVVGNVYTGSGNLTFTDNAGNQGDQVQIVAGYSFSLNDYGSYWQIEVPYSPNTGGSPSYVEDLVSYVNGQYAGLTASFNGSSYTDSLDSLVSMGTVTVTMSKQTTGITTGDKLMVQAGLLSYLAENAVANSASTNFAPYYNGTSVVWGQPWMNAGFANLSWNNNWWGSNTFYTQTTFSAGVIFMTKPQFPTSSTTQAASRIPHGSAPTSPTAGDEWSTTNGFYARVNNQTALTSACRSYALVSVSGGTPSLTSNHNVTSVTDNGVGDFTLNFTQSMPDTSFGVIGSVSGNSGNNGSVVVTARAVGTCRVNTIWNGALADVANFSVAIIR